MWCASPWVARSILAVCWLVMGGLPAVAAATPAARDDGSPAGASIELKLPADIVYSRVPGADTAVVFSHNSHVAFAENRCTACHPQVFPMLQRGPAPSHQNMNEQRSCGVCHNGKDAFDVRDASLCSTCHVVAQAQPLAVAGATGGAAPAAAGRKVPAPHTYPPGESSIGKVTFRHETHLQAAAACSPCHPQLFRMAAAAPLPNGGMHEAAACGACHDGTKSFAATDDAACTRCHVETGARP